MLGNAAGLRVNRSRASCRTRKRGIVARNRLILVTLPLSLMSMVMMMVERVQLGSVVIATYVMTWLPYQIAAAKRISCGCPDHQFQVACQQ